MVLPWCPEINGDHMLATHATPDAAPAVAVSNALNEDAALTGRSPRG
jgi:hypothetical protein